MERVLKHSHEYWRLFLKYTQIYSLSYQELSAHACYVKKEDLLNGQIANSVSRYNLAKSVLVAPHFAKNQNKIFIPYLYHVEIDSKGCLIAKQENPYPIFLNLWLEPSELNPLLLGDKYDFDEYLIQNPPKYIDSAETTWQQQLDYANELLLTLTKNRWQKNLQNSGFVIDDQYGLVFSVAQLLATKNKISYEDYIENRSIAWKDLINQHMILGENKLNVVNKNITLLNTDNKITAKNYIDQLVVNDWIDAILLDLKPQISCIFDRNTNIKRAMNIFDCVDEKYLWLDPKTKSLILHPKLDSSFSITYCVQNYLSKISSYLCKDLSNLADAKQEIFLLLVEKHKVYSEGLSLLTEWQQTYLEQEKEALAGNSANQQLRSLKVEHANLMTSIRHVTALVAIWERMYEVIGDKAKWYYKFIFMHQLQLKKLKTFINTYFPDIDFNKFTLAEIDKILQNKLTYLDQKYNKISEQINLNQQIVIKLDTVGMNCKKWFKQKFGFSEYEDSFVAMHSSLHNFYQNELLSLSIRYYELLFLDNFSWISSNSTWDKYFIDNDNVRFFHRKMDNLFLLNSNEISLPQAIPYLYNTEKAYILTFKHNILIPVIPKALDIKLSELSKLSTNMDEYNYWVKQGIAGNKNTLNQFILNTNLEKINLDNHTFNNKPSINLVKINSSTDHFMGSIQNRGEAIAIIDWMVLHTKNIELDSIVIVVSTIAQSELIKEYLARYALKIQVVHIFNLDFTQTRYAILSLVYTDQDLSRLKVFDYTNALQELISRVTTQLLIVGNEELFYKTFPNIIVQKLSTNFVAS